ncbi:hypothetical protein Taro_020839 [Colocasia esculenta]|uniref:Uncharacterized protein n=1 Tax=Colocasia esculenta TaxID=4460 RepID=A0A843V9Q1_COLES|nr:hypothetical protein [Colocasia esculenta]
MSKPQPSFRSYNRTPKHLGYLNTLHPNPRDEFRTCWGRVEELLVAEELWNDQRSSSSSPLCLLRPAQTVILKSTKGTSLELAGVVWRSSWWLRSCGTTTRSSSSSPLCLLRPAQTVILKSTKDANRAQRVSKGSSLAPMTESHKYTVNHGV